MVALGKILITVVAALGAGGTGTPIELQSGALTAKFSAERGTIRSLAVREHELLAGAGQLLVEVDRNPSVAVEPGLAGFRVERAKGSLTIEGSEPRSGVAVRAQWIAGKDLECRLTLTNSKTASTRAEASVELRLPCVKQTMQMLAPSGDDHLTVDWARSIAVAYRGDARGLVMPAVTFYRPEDDWGLTALADFALPTRGFEVRIDPVGSVIVVRRVHLRLEPGKPVTVSIILAGHEGDWRPGLAHVRDRYPEFFVVADRRVPQLHGAFVCSGGAPKDATIANWKQQHVQTVEVHGTLPFYGQHLPLGDSWVPFADDQWHRLRQASDAEKPAADASWKVLHAYVSRKSPMRISTAQINDYIRRLHAQGIYAVMYFNPTEAWKPWITENYPEALFRDADGKSLGVWYESYLVCPDPESRWGKHLMDEFVKMMDLYPEADGFFMDQSTYDNLDYSHDDGWSIQNGKTAYRMGWAINQISRRCRELAKVRGKFLWWNGPYYSDIAYYAEGMMAEAGNEAQVRTIHYLTLGGRACCTLSTKGEAVFQNCAAYGLYPTAMGDSASFRLAERYWPIFELFRGKQWDLGAHALRLPPGTKGNIFRLPDGNVLVTAVSSERSTDGEAFDLDMPLTVRLSDAAEFHAAYFLSPDLLGKRRLAMERQQDTIRITVPRHRSTSAVLLAKTGVHLAMDGPWGVAPGQQAEATLSLDNWTMKAASGTLGLAGQDELPIRVAPGAAVRHAVKLVAPATRRGLREAVAVRATLEGRPCGGSFEFCVDLPLQASVQMTTSPVGQDQPAVGRVELLNFAAAREIRVALAGDGLRIEPPEATLRLGAPAKGALKFRLRAVQPGKVVLKALASSGSDRSEAQQELDVLATKASPELLRQVRSGILVFDVFGSDHGKYKDKPVLVNGMAIGVVPQHGDHWGQVEMPLTPESLATLREENEVRIENRVGDAFKVRSFQLRLQGPVGLISETNPGVFTSCGWDHAEGKVFGYREPLTGIQIRIPSMATGGGR
jgi:hypothetical protein